MTSEPLDELATLNAPVEKSRSKSNGANKRPVKKEVSIKASQGRLEIAFQRWPR